jgi:lysophospholipase L1-like esterase
MSPLISPGGPSGALITPGNLPVLDRVPNAAVAYGLRRLRSAYTGAAIKVRRSSDNAELDIGFVGNELNVSALLNFVGSANGVIRTWYDQSGNAKNVSQGGTGGPPRIVTAGVLETLNSKPAALFSGGEVLFSGSLSVTQPMSQYTVAAPVSTTVRIMLGSTSGTNAFFTENNLLKINNGTALASLMPAPINTAHVFSGLQSGASSLVAVNGAFNTGTTGSSGISGFELGSWQLGTLGFSGRMAEILIYPAAHNANQRNGVENNLLSYYGIQKSRNYVFDGDSLTVGSYASVSYPNQFKALINGSHYFYNDAVGGQQLTTMDTDAATTIDVRNYPQAPTYLAIWGGTNDITAGASPSTTYNRLKTYVANRAATGKYHQIVVLTLIPREGGTANMFAVNDLIRVGTLASGRQPDIKHSEWI